MILILFSTSGPSSCSSIAITSVFLPVPFGAASATTAAPAGLVVAKISVPVPAERIEVVKNFVCDICGKKYKKAGKLKEHGLSHKPLVCAYCGQMFRS